MSALTQMGFARQGTVIEIRAERPEDIEAIPQVDERAFHGPDEVNLVAMFRKTKKALITLVALSDGQLVGRILFSPVTLEAAPKGFRGIGVAPVGVLPEFQRMGIGSRLIREGLEECKRAGYDAVGVLGDPHYYSRFGFSRACGYQVDNEYKAHQEFMVMELKVGALEGVRGMVKYLPEFREAGC